MFLKSHTELPVEFDVVRHTLTGCPPTCLEAAAEDAWRHARRLMAEVGLDTLTRAEGSTRPARAEVGAAVSSEHVTTVPLRFLVVDHGRWFPSLEGSLDAAWLGPGRTQLTLNAQYEPPHSVIGKRVERTLLHRVVEAVAQRFVESAAQRLTP
jgi:hypothetical protein